MRWAIVMLMLLTMACTPALTRPPMPHGIAEDQPLGYAPPEPTYSWSDCNGWIESQFGWSMTAKVAGVLAGAGTLTASVDEPAVRWSAVSTGALFAGVATVAAFASDHYTARFSRYCQTAPTMPVPAPELPPEPTPRDLPPWSPAGALPSPAGTGGP